MTLESAVAHIIHVGVSTPPSEKEKPAKGLPSHIVLVCKSVSGRLIRQKHGYADPVWESLIVVVIVHTRAAGNNIIILL